MFLELLGANRTTINQNDWISGKILSLLTLSVVDYEEALQVEDKVKWELVMDNEMESLMKTKYGIWLNWLKVSKPYVTSGSTGLKEEHDGTKRIVVKGFQ